MLKKPTTLNYKQTLRGAQDDRIKAFSATCETVPFHQSPIAAASF
jgi:hypothetical protein